MTAKTFVSIFELIIITTQNWALRQSDKGYH